MPETPATDQPSGSRWEPTTDAPGTPSEEPAIPASQPYGEPGSTAPVTHRSWRDRVSPGRAKVAAAAAVVFLAGGVGGFGLGHATADHGGGTGVSGRFSADHDGQRPDGGPGDGGPFGRQPGEQPGQQPGQGTVPGSRT